MKNTYQLITKNDGNMSEEIISFTFKDDKLQHDRMTESHCGAFPHMPT